MPADCLIAQEGQGFTIALDTLDGGRLGIASQSLGIARAAIELIRTHLAAQVDAKGRATASQPDQWTLADLAADLDAYRFLTWRAAILRDQGVRCSTEAAMAKSCASRLANRAARAALSHCTTAARQHIIYDGMKAIATRYLAQWYLASAAQVA